MRLRLRRTSLALGVLATLIVIAAAAGAGAPAAHAFTIRASVSRTAAARPLPSGFLGLAFEYSTIPGLAGSTTPQSVDPVLVALIHSLDPTGQPQLRIGGISTDRTWWPVHGMNRPLGITENLTPAWMASARALAQATGGRFVLGINLEANRPLIASVEAQQLLAGLGRRNIDALEIGNEPDLYTWIPWYKTLGGKALPWYSHAGSPVFSRRPGYGPVQFDQEFARTLRVLPSLPVAGPETGAWLAPFSGFLSRGSRVRMLTSHEYGLNQCVTDPRSPAYPSVPHLLTLTASRGQLGAIGPYVGLAHRDGAGYRIDEMGSISCNGRAGVSNTMASALWLLDALFNDDALGIDGVNLHSFPHSVNGLFDLTRSHGQWQAAVRPLYYGALMFGQAAPAGSRLLRISTGSQAQDRVWATQGADGTMRVLVINDSLRFAVQALVHVPGAGGTAAVERLGAPSPYATGAISLGGRSFGAATSAGVLPAPTPQAVAARSGTYAISLAPASAAMLTIPSGGGGK